MPVNERPFAFTQRGAELVAEATRRKLQEPLRSYRFRGRQPVAGQIILVQLTSAITARSGSTPGTGTANLATWDGTSLGASSDSVTIYNHNKTAISLNLSDGTAKFIQCVRMFGLLWASTDDCP